MQLLENRIFYLHARKTAGNSIQSILLPHSSDTMYLSGHQDGIDRFGIRGPATSLKHATLDDYAKRLPQEWRNYRVALSVRHPFDRALSYYFSPHRWFRKNNHGGFDRVEPTWGLGQFEACLVEMKRMVDFILVDGTFHRPEFLLRYESLEQDFTNFVQSAGLRVDAKLPRRNTSADKIDARKALLLDDSLRKLVEDHFKDDMNFFNY